MKDLKSKDYTSTVKKRIALFWTLLILMIIYNIVVGIMGLGDSRRMSFLAENVSRIIYFGGLIYVIIKIVHWNKILKDKGKLTAQFWSELDERKELIYDKSGGLIFDILLFILLVITCTAAVFEETAFCVSFFILLTAIALKMTGFIVCSKKY